MKQQNICNYENVLVIVDAQNDFVSSDANKEVVQRIAKRLRAAGMSGDTLVYVVRDLHEEDEYFATRESIANPQIHCVPGTDGYDLCWQVAGALDYCTYAQVVKSTLSSEILCNDIRLRFADVVKPRVTVVGFYAESDVVSICLSLRHAMPDLEVCVEPALCGERVSGGVEAAVCVLSACAVHIDRSLDD